MNKNHAKLIRSGIVAARQHMDAMIQAATGNIDVNFVIVMIEKSQPKHPLAHRAYMRTVDGATARLERKVRAHNIARGFHD